MCAHAHSLKALRIDTQYPELVSAIWLGPVDSFKSVLLEVGDEILHRDAIGLPSRLLFSIL